jgi:16S rRNA (guanine966-N2)-methyltransferase
VRIVAGKHRGRPLVAPPGRDLRPTSDRVREAVFNALCHGNNRIGDGDAVRDATILDGFSGTGAVGLEAASRGATQVTLMDRDATALNFCRRNVDALGEQATVTILSGDCLTPVKAASPCSLVFLDPPYGSGMAADALPALARAGWIAEGALCVVELAAKEPFEPPDGITIVDERRYGAARVVFARWSAEEG